MLIRRAFSWAVSMDRQPVDNRLAQVIRERRLTQGEVARAVGVSQPCVSYWVRGKKQPATRHQDLLVRLLGLDPNPWAEG